MFNNLVKAIDNFNINSILGVHPYCNIKNCLPSTFTFERDNLGRIKTFKSGDDIKINIIYNNINTIFKCLINDECVNTITVNSIFKTVTFE